jgi:hypothetical protein
MGLVVPTWKRNVADLRHTHSAVANPQKTFNAEQASYNIRQTDFIRENQWNQVNVSKTFDDEFEQGGGSDTKLAEPADTNQVNHLVTNHGFSKTKNMH